MWNRNDSATGPSLSAKVSRDILRKMQEKMLAQCLRTKLFGGAQIRHSGLNSEFVVRAEIIVLEIINSIENKFGDIEFRMYYKL